MRARSRTRGAADRRREGFILLDSLAAFAVLAITLGTVLVGIAIALRADARANVTRSAIRFAHARLAMTGTEVALEPGLTHGTEPDGLRWQIEMTPLGQQATGASTLRSPRQTGRSNSAAYWVSIGVTTADGGVLQFGTVKLDGGRTP